MTPILSALIAGLFGAVAAAIPVWAVTRRQPSRAVMDVMTIVDASGVVIAQLSEQVRRLEEDVSTAKKKAETAHSDAEKLRKEANRLRDRVADLEAAVRVLGGDPATVVGAGGQ